MAQTVLATTLADTPVGADRPCLWVFARPRHGPHAERHPAQVRAQRDPAAVVFADAYVRTGERLHKAGYVPRPAHDRNDNGWGYVVRVGQTVYFDHGTTPRSVLDAITSRTAARRGWRPQFALSSPRQTWLTPCPVATSLVH